MTQDRPATDAQSGAIGHYDPIEKLFDADQGTFWLCRDVEAGPESPLLYLHDIPFSAKITRAVGDRLLKSWSWTFDLSRERVIGVRDMLLHDDGIAAVCPYVEGQLLASMLLRATVRRAPVPLPVALRIVLDLLEALTEVHAMATQLKVGPKRVFGGLSPNCVLVGTDGVSRLLEPGMAAAAAREQAWGQDLVRVAHSAPESIGEGDDAVVDARSDVFAAGVLLWELLQNQRLFSGPNLSGVVKKVLTHQIERLSPDKAPAGEPIGPVLVSLVARALERDPARRFQSIEQMAHALRAARPSQATHFDVAKVLLDLAGEALTTRRTNIEAALRAPRPAALRAAHAHGRGGPLSMRGPITVDPTSKATATPAPPPSLTLEGAEIAAKAETPPPLPTAPAAAPAPAPGPGAEAAPAAGLIAPPAGLGDSLKPTEVAAIGAGALDVDIEGMAPPKGKGKLVAGAVLGGVAIAVLALWLSGMGAKLMGAGPETTGPAASTATPDTPSTATQAQPAPSTAPVASTETTSEPTATAKPTAKVARTAAAATAGATAEPKPKPKPKPTAEWNPDNE